MMLDEIRQLLVETHRYTRVFKGPNENCPDEQLDAFSYTKNDVGLRDYQVVETGYDHDGYSQEIQRSLDKLVPRKESRQRERARKFVREVLGQGYYGYAYLRKNLNMPLETPTFRWWNWDKRLPIISLINPGGSIYVKAGGYTMASVATPPAAVAIQGKNDIDIRGDGGGTKLITSGTAIPFYIGDRVSAPNVSTRIALRDLYIDGTSQTAATVPENTDANVGVEMASPAGGSATLDILLDRLQIFNTGSDAIYYYGSGDNMIRNCTIRQIRGYWGAIHAHLAHKLTVIGCLIAQCSASGGIRHSQYILGNKIVSTGAGAASDGSARPSIMGADPSVVNGQTIGTTCIANRVENATSQAIGAWSGPSTYLGNICARPTGGTNPQGFLMRREPSSPGTLNNCQAIGNVFNGFDTACLFDTTNTCAFQHNQLIAFVTAISFNNTNTAPIISDNPGFNVGAAGAQIGLDNRTLTTADGSPITLTTVPYSGSLVRVSVDIFATAYTSGTATYTLTWTENSVSRTLVVTATVLNTLGTGTDLINPDNGTTITAQLTGAFVATVKVAAIVELLA